MGKLTNIRSPLKNRDLRIRFVGALLVLGSFGLPWLALETTCPPLECNDFIREFATVSGAELLVNCAQSSLLAFLILIPTSVAIWMIVETVIERFYILHPRRLTQLAMFAIPVWIIILAIVIATISDYILAGLKIGLYSSLLGYIMMFMGQSAFFAKPDQ